MTRQKEFFTAERCAALDGKGHKSPDAILIVGLLRAGSTLLEQILGSRSAERADSAMAKA